MSMRARVRAAARAFFCPEASPRVARALLNTGDEHAGACASRGAGLLLPRGLLAAHAHAGGLPAVLLELDHIGDALARGDGEVQALHLLQPQDQVLHHPHPDLRAIEERPGPEEGVAREAN